MEPRDVTTTRDHDAEETTADDKASREEASRVRFRGIVESGETALADERDYDFTILDRDERRWNSMSRQVWLVSRLTAVFVFFSFIVGLPFGNWLAHLKLYGDSTAWNPLSAYGVNTILFAFIVPALLVLMGYILSRSLTMLNAAESIAAAAQQFITPDISAARNVETVGAVVQSQVATMNEGIDGALQRLATVEAMIRKHVEAIEIAGDAIEQKATGAVTRVADERSRLMDLTESLNAHADSFAAAIAEKAKASIEAMQSADELSLRAENELEDRLAILETAASRALASFESLRDALRDTDESMRQSAQSIASSADQTTQATKQANAAAMEAAESAARNAANVSASANRAAEEAKRAANSAIETATQEAERLSREAIEAAAAQSGMVRDATTKALGEISDSTRSAIDSAVDDAAKATKAAEEVSQAARKTGEAAAKASADVAAASERARESSQTALKFSETEAARIDERNQALAQARAALEKENARLESLIDEQRKRADRLAEAIASQTERLSRLAEAQLREQEAAARLAEAQNEMQARADRQAAEKKRTAQFAAESKPAPPKSETRKAPLQSAPKAAPNIDNDDALELTPKRSAPAKEKAPPPRKKNGAGRLDELARDIAERRPRNKTAAEKKSPIIDRKKGDVSWREILDAAEDAEPLDLGPASQKSASQKNGASAPDEENAIRIISRLQDFTYDLETRLYGDPPPALAERFDRGDRNVFANRLLRLNEADIKRRIRTESGRDKVFEKSVHGFLHGFESLLEDATTSETADEELEEYLSSPLGRVYLLIGATVGYFA